MKKLSLVLSVVLGLVMLLSISAISVEPGTVPGVWIKDTICGVVNGQKTYDWYWVSPVTQPNSAAPEWIIMDINCAWTDYGHQNSNIPAGVHDTSYRLEINLNTNQYREVSLWHFDFNHNVVSQTDFPFGDQMVTPQAGSMAQRWIDVARTAPKSPYVPTVPYDNNIQR
jgi:hypothetical protein